MSDFYQLLLTVASELAVSKFMQILRLLDRSRFNGFENTQITVLILMNVFDI